MFGQPFKLLIAIFAGTNWPECTHNTLLGKGPMIMRMADIKSQQDKRNRYSALVKANMIKKSNRFEYMINPNLFFVGTPKQKQEAIEKYKNL